MLVARHWRERRGSLFAALAVSAITVGAIPAWIPMPYAAAESLATAVAVLAVAWTLGFASDAFASDVANRRLATHALLPVSAWTLWSARSCFVFLAVLAQVAWSVAFAFAFLHVRGEESALTHFSERLLPFLSWLPGLFAIASVALLCSLLLEHALAALVASILMAGPVAVGLHRAFERFAGLGESLTTTAGFAIAGVTTLGFLAAGWFGFARGQRRLGNRRVRTRSALAVLSVALAAGGTASAAYLRNELILDLTQPGLRFGHVAASANDRWLALEAGRHGGSRPRHASVWILDLDTGARQELVASGVLLPDLDRVGAPSWNPAEPLRVVRTDSRWVDPTPELISVHAATNGLTITREVLGKRIQSLVSSRAAPWAEVVRAPKSSPTQWVAVRWGEREVRFEGDTHFVGMLVSILPTPEPGKILVRRGDSLRIHDMGDASECVVLDSGVSRAFQPSPDRSAALVPGPVQTRVLDAATGELLHAAWPSAEFVVQWCETSGAERVVRVRRKAPLREPSRIIDLDTGVEFEVEIDSTQSLLLRIGSRGYVFVRAGGDLVWVDLAGRLVKVLVER
jgi:hypothetical protein